MSTTQFDHQLIQDLKNRQAEHRQCLGEATRLGFDPRESCVATAWRAAECYRDWARYRAPFKTPEAEAELAAYRAKETKKEVAV